MTRLLRITALLLILTLFAAVLSSCTVVDKLKQRLSLPSEAPRGIPETNDQEFINLDSGEYTYSDHYTPVHPRHSFEMLDQGQQALYNALYDNVRDVYPETDENEELYKTKQAIIEGHQLSVADIRITTKALYDDNPDLFWLSGTVYQLTDPNADYTAVQMRSIYSPEEIKTMQDEIDSAVNAFYATVPDNLSAYEREKFAHDHIAEICEYDTEAAESSDDDSAPEAYNVYGVLVRGKAVCEGYARAMQLLLSGLGVDCVGITGMSSNSDGKEELHMWDAVKLDDGWYYVDPTWDDQDQAYRRYQYFNLNEVMMSKDHQNSRLMSELSENEIDSEETLSSSAMNLYIPECTATKYMYYRYECAHLTDYDGEDVINALYRAALDQKEHFTFYIDPDALDYDETIEVLFRESPQYFFDYAEDVNSWLSDYEIDNSNMTYYTNEERCAVTVMLNYY